MTPLLANILDALPLAIAVKDDDGRYLVANSTFLQWLAPAAGALRGRSDAECFDGPVLQWLQTMADGAAAGMAAPVPPMQINGRPLSGRLLRLDENPPLWIVVLQPDEARIVAKASHDLRTPLNAMVGWLHLLDLGSGGPIFDKAVAGLKRAVEEQRALLDELAAEERPRR
ncbi:MAG TPA: PAS domain-containing protein [Burkholderiaceae bacterium]|nr:PAS domain-containing protein [Burkholderiaceae bacterium]